MVRGLQGVGQRAATSLGGTVVFQSEGMVQEKMEGSEGLCCSGSLQETEGEWGRERLGDAQASGVLRDILPKLSLNRFVN